jgi:ATP-independent RNA helicase DbpA
MKYFQLLVRQSGFVINMLCDMHFQSINDRLENLLYYTLIMMTDVALTHPINYPLLPFTSLALHPLLLSNLASLGFDTMTAIQARSLPIMLNGQDVVAQARTGSGKTAAFGLLLLNQLNLKLFAVQGLILCPTRELASQVSQVLRQLARLFANVKIVNLSGGTPIKSQHESLRHGAHIIVGTPGRIKKQLDNTSLSLDKLKILVLDEADRMLDMGFIEDVKAIVACCPTSRQTVLFSATYPRETQTLYQDFLKHPQKIIIETNHNHHTIKQRFYEVANETEKYAQLTALLRHHQLTSTLIFCNTKQATIQLTTLLQKDGFSALALHGDMEQLDRTRAVIAFMHQSCSILVATDVAARGLDIKDLPAVINYDLAFELDSHTHRIGRTGRTGRADNTGIALSLTMPADAHRLRIIEDAENTSLIWGTNDELIHVNRQIPVSNMVTFCITAGRRDKIRAGDILGALTKDAGLMATLIGKITITDLYAYVSVQKQCEKAVMCYFKSKKLKKRTVNAYKLIIPT